MGFELPALNYKKNELEPHISEETIEYHYGKHHQTYITNLNNLVADTVFEEQSLEEIVKQSSGGMFNNAAQVWNHSFYWNCLSAKFDQQPGEELLAALNQKFGSYEQFKALFTKTAITTFGSGWAWLVKNKDGSLDVVSTSNANNPMTENQQPLLTCDVWEHAYYVDYRNARPKYVDAFWTLLNWQFVNEQFSK